MDTPSPGLLIRYRYPLLITAYACITGAAFLRVSRQPYSRSIKWEQYETIFKFTTLGAVLVGIGTGGLKRRNDMRG
ncbi:hypothetical protein P171DRAFT_429844 [Karstenula rhodostoma CBS 690.94]|uniref:Uncharacterized protein n=1 Tax=Karstenula rhodostoma CBS 690.94 TaxID=1392251 RepID=A0A9P4UCN1_9PLEO|nr:hypothetical protein P171DRAFT_429844 [Karstenula rhodostoma CBS 690.94]